MQPSRAAVEDNETSVHCKKRPKKARPGVQESTHCTSKGKIAKEKDYNINGHRERERENERASMLKWQSTLKVSAVERKVH